MNSKANAGEIISAVLPAHVLEKLDLDTLKKLPDSFTNNEFQNFRADVVYECHYLDGNPRTITLLFEHKSYRVKYPHIQVLDYIMEIWKSQIRNGDGPGQVLAIIFYHGRGSWNYKSFEEYFQGGNVDDELRRYTPHFEYVLVDLAENGDDWINHNFKRTELRISISLMRNIRSKNLVGKIPMIFEGVQELLATEEGRERFLEIYLYLYLGSSEPEEKIKEAMDRITLMNLPIPKGSTAWQMMIKEGEKRKSEGRAEGLLEGKAEGLLEGKAEGLLEGKAEGKLEVAIGLLKEGIDPEVIAKATGFSIAEIDKLQEGLAFE